MFPLILSDHDNQYYSYHDEQKKQMTHKEKNGQKEVVKPAKSNWPIAYHID